MKALLAAVGLISLACTCLAGQPARSDWRAFGAAKVAGQPVELFYLSNDVERTPDGGFARVWTKALNRPELERAVDKLDAGVSAEIAARLKGGYIPPLSQMRTLTNDQVAWVAASEQVASDAKLEPTTLVQYEVDCPKQLMRQLRSEIAIKGRRHSSGSASEWAPIPPEGNMTVLHTLVCTSG
jgi:hypothetical protein